jgi:single-strand DNA-binding protein
VGGQPGVWADAETSFYDVVTYRALAANVGVSVRKGHPVTIHGRQHIVSRARDDGTTWWGVEVVADAVGHDLSYGTAAFARVSRGQFSDSDRTAATDAPETFADVGLGDPERDPYVVDGAPAAGGTGDAAEGDSDGAEGPDTGPLVPAATEPAA